MAKTLDTLVEDIYALFEAPHEVSEGNLEQFGEEVKACVLKGITEASKERDKNLRMSAVGKPARQQWFDKHREKPDLPSHMHLTFLFGHIIEALLVLLIKESGHTIEYAQDELEIDGIIGHTDGCIDKVPSDIKSASGFQFRSKFAGGQLLREGNEYDPYGYKGQISAYREALLKKYPDDGIVEDEVAWLAMSKENGMLTVLKADVFSLINAEKTIGELKEQLGDDNPPTEKCFPEQSLGESGNRVLHSSCGYCPFKYECWKDSNEGRGLRTFKYSNGPKFFTNVGKLPKVEELTHDDD